MQLKKVTTKHFKIVFRLIDYFRCKNKKPFFAKFFVEICDAFFPRISAYGNKFYSWENLLYYIYILHERTHK